MKTINLPSQVHVGTNIKLVRQSKQIKQSILAKTLGISSVALSNIENNKTDITINRLLQIATALNVEADLLLSASLIIGKKS